MKTQSMKAYLIFLTGAVATVAVNGAVVYTNLNGMVLGLELAHTSVVAGERLIGTMIVSNASQVMTEITWTKGAEGEFDTGVGKFLVIDENGFTLPKTVPLRLRSAMGVRGSPFAPGVSQRFDGDIVWGYSLTNPGNYLVKTIGAVPLTNDTGARLTFMAETPPIAITVIPRDANSPPPAPLYPLPTGINTPEALAMLQKEEEMMRAEAARLNASEQRAAMPRIAPRESRSALPQSVQERVGNGATAGPGGVTANKEATPSAYRNVAFVVITLLLSGGVAIYLWWSRRKHGHP